MNGDNTHPPINAESFPHGIVCGCECGCERVLDDGNSMLQQVEERSEPTFSDPLEIPIDDLLTSGPIGAPVFVSICAQCYVGDHRQELV